MRYKGKYGESVRSVSKSCVFRTEASSVTDIRKDQITTKLSDVGFTTQQITLNRDVEHNASGDSVGHPSVIEERVIGNNNSPISQCRRNISRM